MKQIHFLPEQPKEAAILKFAEDAYPAYTIDEAIFCFRLSSSANQ